MVEIGPPLDELELEELLEDELELELLDELLELELELELVSGSVFAPQALSTIAAITQPLRLGRIAPVSNVVIVVSPRVAQLARHQCDNLRTPGKWLPAPPGGRSRCLQ